MGFWVIGYVGWAIVYAAVTLGSVLVLASLVGLTVARRHWLLIGVTVFFIFLTQHPFPDRAQMTCPHPGGGVDLWLFSYLGEARRIMHEDRGILGLFLNLTLASMAMNFVLCIGIGMLCVGSGLRVLTSAILMVMLSILIEVAQLTGLFGLFRCAYREFSVNDFFLNMLGAWTGAWIGTRIGWLSPRTERG